jgi:ring-1,2-phenylacetyl-CoA epoxidase subunit PaaC
MMKPVNESTNQLINYLLHLADSSLILGHRNSEWCGHGPVLEQDIAITNISLDLIGQARNFYQYAASLIGGDATEDTLAYLRNANEFKNCIMTELPKGDWAFTILRQFYFSNYQYLLFQQLQNSRDEQIAAISVKALKEVTYHLRWSSEWVIRLGDGTEESRSRIEKAMKELSDHYPEFFEPADYEKQNAETGTGVDPASLKEAWEKKTREIFDEAGLKFDLKSDSGNQGKQGKHTEHLNQILSEMQYLQRSYPNSQW